jgi:acyl-CoA thioester hydrolase
LVNAGDRSAGTCIVGVGGLKGRASAMDRQYWQMGQGDFRVTHMVRVRFNELDGTGIVFNGNYLVYADIGVTEYFRALGEGQPGQYFRQYGTDIVVVNAELDYHASARLDELITIAARVSRFGRTSFTLHCAIFRGEERMTDIALTYAHVGLDSGRAEPLPASFIAEVRRFEAIMPA